MGRRYHRRVAWRSIERLCLKMAAPFRTLRSFSSVCGRCFLAMTICGFAACDRQTAEIQRLTDENTRLKTELERLRNPSETGSSAAPGATPDFDLTMAELWTQRFEDSDTRARKRLADKLVRVTGRIESVRDDKVSITGTSRSAGSVRMSARLNSAYANRVEVGLASLEKGAAVTVQGRLDFDRMALNDAQFVDRTTGKALLSEDLAALSIDGGAATPVTPN